jgi:hypothetical protein
MDENWCKLFTKEDFNMLSYYNDLKGKKYNSSVIKSKNPKEDFFSI